MNPGGKLYIYWETGPVCSSFCSFGDREEDVIEYHLLRIFRSISIGSCFYTKRSRSCCTIGSRTDGSKQRKRNVWRPIGVVISCAYTYIHLLQDLADVGGENTNDLYTAILLSFRVGIH